ncbi:MULTISPECIES: hypothetical protein [unclassified Ochrobactrum]|uniref:hypothetical protein n=1 Tax=unclassified Ochrobactrum TaxID=239106 RepID=UPI000DF0079D|nr:MULTISPECIES: hypothetical protein [unclassified Ochrobactrum]MBQ0709914.1 hypothetical protein [Ochrobactrum sp. AP1BH01-1]
MNRPKYNAFVAASVIVGLVSNVYAASATNRDDLIKIVGREDQVQGLLDKGQGAVEGFEIMFRFSKIWKFCSKDKQTGMWDNAVEGNAALQCCVAWHTAAPHVAAIKVVLPWLSDIEDMSTPKGYEKQTKIASFVAGKIISEKNENLSKALGMVTSSTFAGTVNLCERGMRER